MQVSAVSARERAHLATGGYRTVRWITEATVPCWPCPKQAGMWRFLLQSREQHPQCCSTSPVTNTAVNFVRLWDAAPSITVPSLRLSLGCAKGSLHGWPPKTRN